MDKEISHYIIRYFSDLLTDHEKLALRYHMYADNVKEDSAMRKMMIKRGWITQNEDAINLLQNGYEEFELEVAKRIMKEEPEKVFFNNCPVCHKLARTPYAKQCRYCGNSWRS